MAEENKYLIIKDLVKIAEISVRKMWNHNEITDSDLSIIYSLFTFRDKRGAYHAKSLAAIGIEQPIIHYLIEKFASKDITLHNISDSARSNKLCLQVVFAKNATVRPDYKKKKRSRSPTSPDYSPIVRSQLAPY